MTNRQIQIDKEKVRERIDEYILNKGYRVERIFSCERFGIDRGEDLIAAATILVNGLMISNMLDKRFAPVGEIYQRGRELFTKASVLSPEYDNVMNEKLETALKIEANFENNRKHYLGELNNSKGIFNKLNTKLELWCLNRLEKSVKKSWESTNPLPTKFSEDESLDSLNCLYNWVQIGKEDEESREALDELVHPSEIYSNTQKELLEIRSNLYKIKNHTAIVCLDQLQKYGLKLEEPVSIGISKIPKNYLLDAHTKDSGFALKNSYIKFGDGLFYRGA